ncbi:S49 family peptidase [Salinarimonas ramus]|uniref:Peptidase S49 n=1 Tax=Salinarimonas ramus TaxID=690164 RepID=A0A917QJ57_9HYPH|nr:S49 family peptidase [Salinarimonas ramus]GGK53070.1 peptidase S49 [Salinarimonas ramus]
MPSLKDRLRFLFSRRYRAEHPLVPVVRLSGAIGVGMGLRQGLSFQGVAGALERAFSMPGAKAVALLVNSPGGSPTQSHLIHRRIRLLAKEKELPVYAFCEDAAASGGYMIACAADEIWADPNSIVGSIGVVSGGFGFHELIERWGVERRLYTTGENKAILDPFRPEDPKDVARLRTIQERIFTGFKDMVRARRGEKLDLTNEAELFSGAFWAGEDAKALGLVDGIGEIRETLREKLGEKVRLRLVQPPRPGLIQQLLRRGPQQEAPLFGSGAFGSGLIDPRAALATLEERALWARLGL